MKEIPNIQFTDTQTTATTLLTCLNNPGKDGLDFAAMRARNKVADAIEKVEAGGVIKLEDSEYATAQNAIKEVRWVSREDFLLKFAEQFGL